MSYDWAMEVAGAEILEYQQFGSYQGDWWALVRYDGKVGWVKGSYGSCSGCDAFEAEFDYATHDVDEGDELERYEVQHDPMDEGFYEGCEKCDDLKKRLVEFGKSYLDPIMSQEEAEKEAETNDEWDTEAQEMIQFIKDHAVKEN